MNAVSYRQVDGDVFIEAGDMAEMVISKDNTIALLSTVLNAIRVENDAEKMALAAKVCMAHLGRARFG